MIEYKKAAVVYGESGQAVEIGLDGGVVCVRELGTEGEPAPNSLTVDAGTWPEIVAAVESLRAQ